jgi:hypothetical protein
MGDAPPKKTLLTFNLTEGETSEYKRIYLLNNLNFAKCFWDPPEAF